jgi:hypothetical protein
VAPGWRSCPGGFRALSVGRHVRHGLHRRRAPTVPKGQPPNSRDPVVVGSGHCGRGEQKTARSFTVSIPGRACGLLGTPSLSEGGVSLADSPKGPVRHGPPRTVGPSDGRRPSANRPTITVFSPMAYDSVGRFGRLIPSLSGHISFSARVGGIQVNRANALGCRSCRAAGPARTPGSGSHWSGPPAEARGPDFDATHVQAVLRARDGLRRTVRPSDGPQPSGNRPTITTITLMTYDGVGRFGRFGRLFPPSCPRLFSRAGTVAYPRGRRKKNSSREFRDDRPDRPTTGVDDS